MCFYTSDFASQFKGSWLDDQFLGQNNEEATIHCLLVQDVVKSGIGKAVTSKETGAPGDHGKSGEPLGRGAVGILADCVFFYQCFFLCNRTYVAFARCSDPSALCAEQMHIMSICVTSLLLVNGSKDFSPAQNA